MKKHIKYLLNTEAFMLGFIFGALIFLNVGYGMALFMIGGQ